MNGPRRGSVLVLVAGAVSMLMGMAALVADVSVLLSTRTKEQAAVDAAALAACYSLAYPQDLAAATASAQSLSGRNGFALAATDVTYWNHPSGSTGVTVRCRKSVPALFAPLFGKNSFDVAATASATLGHLPDSKNVLPFALPSTRAADGSWLVDTGSGLAPLSTAPPTQLLLKAPPPGTSGNFQPLCFQGRGAADFENTIVNGLSAPAKTGDVVTTEPGDMNGPVAKGVKARLASGNVLALVPLVDASDWSNIHGRGNVTLMGFLHVRLTGLGPKNEVLGEYIEHVYSAPATLANRSTPGAYAPLLIPTP